MFTSPMLWEGRVPYSLPLTLPVPAVGVHAVQAAEKPDLPRAWVQTYEALATQLQMSEDSICWLNWGAGFSLCVCVHRKRDPRNLTKW